jgi:DNA-binding response OmpR family regulator
MNALNLLMVEDDESLADMTAAELRDLGHQVRVVGDGRQAFAVLSNESFDAVVLDRMLPHVDGVSLLQRLRNQNVTIPVIMVSALGRSLEKVEGLEAGADDYVAKPVPAAELLARIQAVLRGRHWVGNSADTLRAGDIVVSPTTFRAWRNGRSIELPKNEFNLLTEMVRSCDTVLTRSMLLERVWGYDFDPATNIVDVYVRRLRMKLIGDGEDDPIATVRGVGYMLRG